MLWLSQDPEVRVPSFAGPRVLREAKEVAAGALGQSGQCRDRLCSSRLRAGWRAAAPPQLGAVRRYTMFSAPGSGPCGGPRSCLLCSWASCSTGMLQSGHTFRTSSHLIRHLQKETTQEGRGQARALGIELRGPAGAGRGCWKEQAPEASPPSGGVSPLGQRCPNLPGPLPPFQKIFTQLPSSPLKVPP